MKLSTQQKQTLKGAILANPSSLALWTVGDFPTLTNFVNAATETMAWRQSVPPIDMFNAVNIAAYDNIVAGKRDAFRLMLDFGPVDATNAGTRKGILDVFDASASQQTAMLTACTEPATWAEVALGSTIPSGSVGTLAGVIKRNVIGFLSVAEVAALQGV